MGIAATVRAFRSAPSVRSAFQVLLAIKGEGRLSEALYGAWCFARYRASQFDTGEPVDGASDALERIFRAPLNWADLDAATAEELMPAFMANFIPRETRIRANSILVGDGWCVAGEYGDGCRLFYGDHAGTQSISTFYEADPAVIHIHLLHKLEGQKFAVCTGDSGKYLDIWEVAEHGIRFVERLISRFAGYTAAATVSGEHYFGTDFSQRPNYLLRLGDRRKFPFPGASFKHYAVQFAPYEDRYILCLAKGLYLLDPTWSRFVFDTFEERFIRA